MGRRTRAGFTAVIALSLAIVGCQAGASGPSPTDPHGFTTTTTLLTTTTTLPVEQGLESYRECLSGRGVTVGQIRLDGLGRPRMADALSDVDLTDRAVLDALEACGQLIASGPLAAGSDPELAALVRDRLRELSQCIRRAGVPDYPDPVDGFDGVGSPFPIRLIPWDDPDVAEAVDLCSRELGQ